MVKHQLKVKKAKRERKFIKDKAIVNFLLEHMKPIKINFSKIKIPSFINFIENEQKETLLIQTFFKDKTAQKENPIVGKSLLNAFYDKAKK